MDRYFWSICNALAEIDDWASADMIRMKLKDHRVDLTSMRIATRISHNKLIEVMEDSEPYLYRLKEMFKDKPFGLGILQSFSANYQWNDMIM